MNILPPPALMELLKYSPYPEVVFRKSARRWGWMAQCRLPCFSSDWQQAEQALQVLEGELKKALEKSTDKEHDNEIDGLKTIIEDYRAQTERLQAMWNAQISAAGKPGTGEDGSGGTPAVELTVSPENTPSPLEEKVDMLAMLMQQILAGMGQSQQPTEAVPPPPTEQPPMEPQA
jgi:hypothetical protein